MKRYEMCFYRRDQFGNLKRIYTVDFDDILVAPDAKAAKAQFMEVLRNAKQLKPRSYKSCSEHGSYTLAEAYRKARVFRLQGWNSKLDYTVTKEEVR